MKTFTLCMQRNFLLKVDYQLTVIDCRYIYTFDFKTVNMGNSKVKRAKTLPIKNGKRPEPEPEPEPEPKPEPEPEPKPKPEPEPKYSEVSRWHYLW